MQCTDRLEVAVLQLIGELHRLRRPADRPGRVAASKRADRHVAQQVGIGVALVDLGGQAPARLEQLERSFVVAELLLGLAEVVDHAALERAVADRASDGERFAVVVAGDAVTAALCRENSVLPKRGRLDAAVANFARQDERLLDVRLRARRSRPGTAARVPS